MQPNILFLFSDQHRPHAISSYGDPNIETVNIDRLAREGVRLTNAYSTCPLCAPFRASLYTGQYPTTHGVTCLFKPLLPRQPTLPEVLRESGYHTSHMGKWHLSGGDCPSHYVSPYFRPGWDEWMGWENSNEPWQTEYGIGDMPSPMYRFEKYQTDAVTDLCVDWLAGSPSLQPWFHVVSVEPPHPDRPLPGGYARYEAPEPYMELFADKELQLRPNFRADTNRGGPVEDNLRGYYAQIKNLDDNIGRILDSLEQSGQADNTIVAYFADHGDMMGSHGLVQKSRPEEESSRIPFILRWPKAVPAGLVSNALFNGVDIMPTVLSLASVDAPPGVEGVDASGMFRGGDAAPREDLLVQFERNFFSHQPDYQRCYRMIRRENWKYTVFLAEGPTQLYDLENDPYEMENLVGSGDTSGVQAELDALLRQRCDELGDDFFARQRQYREASAD